MRVGWRGCFCRCRVRGPGQFQKFPAKHLHYQVASCEATVPRSCFPYSLSTNKPVPRLENERLVQDSKFTRHGFHIEPVSGRGVRQRAQAAARSKVAPRGQVSQPAFPEQRRTWRTGSRLTSAFLWRTFERICMTRKQRDSNLNTVTQFENMPSHKELAKRLDPWRRLRKHS